VIDVTETEVISVLRDFGLTQKEAEVYVFLTKSGIQKAGEVSKRLKMHKAQVYRILETLRNRGFVEATLDFPLRFVPISFDNCLDMVIKAKKEEAFHLESRKLRLLANLRSSELEKPVPQQAKFSVLKGRQKVYARILQLVEEAKMEVLAMTDNIGIIRSEQAGIFDLTKKRDANFRILTNISKDNYLFVKKVLQKTLPKNFRIEGRHKDLGTKPYPRFVIRDNQEIVFFLTPAEESSAPSNPETILWTNNQEIVSALRIFFEASWENATDLGIRISEIETGTTTVETIILRDAEVAHQKFCEIVEQTRKEITAISPSNGLTTFLMKCLVPLHLERNITAHIMVPLDVDNLETVEEMSKHLQVKYAGSFHMGMAIIDDKHLFMFKTPLQQRKQVKSSAYFEQMLYTNDADYVKNMKSMLEDLWYKAPDVSDLEVAAAMRSPAVTVSIHDSASRVIEVMHTNDIGSVVVVDGETPVGIVTEKDLLNRVVVKRLNLQKTTAQEIMSSPLITIGKERTLMEAIKIMRTREIRRLVVLEEGKLEGILSERRLLERSEGQLQEIKTRQQNPRD
jgi:sugar-specific transcriptional regulator TrmB/CBS domain-containing protein